MIKKGFVVLLTVCFLGRVQSLAQDIDIRKKYTAFDMRSNGKIYVVVTVLLIILFGLLGYLFRLDRRISRLEKESKK